MNAQAMRTTALMDQAWARVVDFEDELPVLIEKLKGGALLTEQDRAICAMVLCTVAGKIYFDKASINGETE